MKKTNRKIKAKISLILSLLIFGTIGLFVKELDIPTSLTALIRACIAVAVLVPFMYIRKKAPDLTAIKKNIFLLILSGAFMGFNWILLFESYRYTTVPTATLCYYFSPVFIIIVSPFLLKEKTSAVKAICVIAALCGMIPVSGILEGGKVGDKEYVGIMLALLAAVLYAGVVIINKKLKGISSFDATVSQLAFAACVLIPYNLLSVDFSAISIGMRSGIILLVLGLVHTGFAYILYFGSFPKLDSQTVALFGYIDPVSAIILSWIFLDEKLSIFGILGAVLILGSTLVSEIFGNKK